MSVYELADVLVVRKMNGAQRGNQQNCGTGPQLAQRRTPLVETPWRALRALRARDTILIFVSSRLPMHPILDEIQV